MGTNTSQIAHAVVEWSLRMGLLFCGYGCDAARRLLNLADLNRVPGGGIPLCHRMLPFLISLACGAISKVASFISGVLTVHWGPRTSFFGGAHAPPRRRARSSRGRSWSGGRGSWSGTADASLSGRYLHSWSDSLCDLGPAKGRSAASGKGKASTIVNMGSDLLGINI